MLSQRQSRLCFESELSDLIIKNSEYFINAINKISERIISLLIHPENAAFLMKNQILSDAIISQLYSDTHFGTLDHAIPYCPTQVEFLNAMIKVLSFEQIHLPRILHLHQIFMQNIFDKLVFKSGNGKWKEIKDELVTKLFKNELFI